MMMWNGIVLIILINIYVYLIIFESHLWGKLVQKYRLYFSGNNQTYSWTVFKACVIWLKERKKQLVYSELKLK